jgi:hypothetical protein
VIPLALILGVLFVIYLANHGLGLIIAIVVLLYLGDVTLRPRVKCRMCDGTGMILKSGRHGAQCPVCKGRKIHTRLGAMIWRRHRYMFRDDPEVEADENAPPTLHDRGWW